MRKLNWTEVMEVIRPWKSMLPAVSVALVMGVSLAGYQAKVYADPTPANTEPQTEEVEKETETETASELIQGSFELEDGEYEGKGTGYGGTISVKVSIKERSIQSIEILSASGEDEKFFNRAKKLVDDMLEEQTVEVDTVSGATYSSKGIIAAVKNALYGTADTNTTAKKASAALEEVEEGDYTDGVYTGSGTGFGGKVKVQVTIADGKITDIQITEASGEGADYLNRASALTGTIITAQTTNVDAVSGATYTSKGIIKAVRNALTKAEGGEVEEEETEAAEGTLPYIDGVFYGTGTGFSGDITVALAIQDKTLKAAIITESKDDEAFLNKAKSILYSAVKQQSIEIDAVTSATYSSNGILEAMKNAIKAAKKATKNQSTTLKTDTKTETETETEIKGDTNTGKTYKDGTYTVMATCSPNERKQFDAYELSMKVTIKGDKITAVKDVKGSGSDYDSTNDTFIAKAVDGTGSIKGVVSQITASGKASGIDAVTGATCTSKAIIEGCKKALKQAKLSTSEEESESSDTENSETSNTESGSTENSNTGSGSTENGTTGSTGSDTNTSTNPDTGAATPDSTEGGNSGNPSTETGGADAGAETPKVYKDGSYQVQVTCSPDKYNDFDAYTLTATVTVTNHVISAVTDIKGSGGDYVKYNDTCIANAVNGTAKYTGVVTQIIAKGNADNIDAVTNATCSSTAIIEACKKALEESLK